MVFQSGSTGTFSLHHMLGMDQIFANKLFEDGAFLFLPEVPIGTEIGIDFYSWKTGEKFKGIKMIPPGIHYIYYSSVSKEGSVAPRTGFFYNFNKREVLICRWNPEIEDIIKIDSDEEKECIKANLRNLDQHLGPYPFNTWKKWLSLSSKLTTLVVKKVEPLQQKISSVTELISEVAQVELPVKRKQITLNYGDNLLTTMRPKPGTELNFTKVPSRSFPEGSSAIDITKYSIDTSYILEQMLSNWESSIEMLAELQMAFLCFLIGQVYCAFEHWKNMIRIFSFADEFLLKNPSLIIEFIGDLYFQLKEVSPDIFVDIISSENFLIQTLRVLFSNILENDCVDLQLKRKAMQLKQFVTQRFQWDFDIEPDDEAPVLVDIVGSS